ncbi:MAG: hypothetical protein OHK0024_27540 [Thalassobaculales bacterium]
MAELAWTPPLAVAAIERDGLRLAAEVPQAQLLLRLPPDDAAGLELAAAAIGCRLPVEPNRRLAGDGIYALWQAPDAWLVVSDLHGREALSGALASALAGRFAAVSDLTDGLAVIALEGPRAPQLLAAGTGLDLALPAGTAAITRFADWRVRLYRHGGPGRFRLHVERGHAAACWRWLAALA